MKMKKTGNYAVENISKIEEYNIVCHNPQAEYRDGGR
jgi:hypothetical protein